MSGGKRRSAISSSALQLQRQMAIQSRSRYEAVSVSAAGGQGAAVTGAAEPSELPYKYSITSSPSMFRFKEESDLTLQRAGLDASQHSAARDSIIGGTDKRSNSLRRLMVTAADGLGKQSFSRLQQERRPATRKELLLRKINIATMSFDDPDVEELFILHYEDKFLARIRRNLIIGSLIWSLPFVVWEVLNEDYDLATVIGSRIGALFVVACVLVADHLYFKKHPMPQLQSLKSLDDLIASVRGGSNSSQRWRVFWITRRSQLLLSMMTMCLSLAQNIYIVANDEVHKDNEVMGIVLLLAGVATLCFPRFIFFAFISHFIVACFAGLAYWPGVNEELSSETVMYNVITVLGCAWIFNLLVWRTEFQERLYFFTLARLHRANQNSRDLLTRMLPKPVIALLTAGEQTIAQRHKEVTLMFSDFKDFERLFRRTQAVDIVRILDLIFALFDRCADTHDVYKVETIGCTYLAACGVPDPVEDHAVNICNLALDLMSTMHNTEFLRTEIDVELARLLGSSYRVGIHSGPLIAGVIGRKLPRYRLFGDTVNTASRMCTTAEAGTIQVSEATVEILRRSEECYELFMLHELGPRDIKGKGTMTTFRLTEANAAVPREAVVHKTASDGTMSTPSSRMEHEGGRFDTKVIGPVRARSSSERNLRGSPEQQPGGPATSVGASSTGRNIEEAGRQSKDDGGRPAKRGSAAAVVHALPGDKKDKERRSLVLAAFEALKVPIHGPQRVFGVGLRGSDGIRPPQYGFRQPRHRPYSAYRPRMQRNEEPSGTPLRPLGPEENFPMPRSRHSTAPSVHSGAWDHLSEHSRAESGRGSGVWEEPLRSQRVPPSSQSHAAGASAAVGEAESGPQKKEGEGPRRLITDLRVEELDEHKENGGDVGGNNEEDKDGTASEGPVAAMEAYAAADQGDSLTGGGLDLSHSDSGSDESSSDDEKAAATASSPAPDAEQSAGKPPEHKEKKAMGKIAAIRSRMWRKLGRRGSQGVEEVKAQTPALEQGGSQPFLQRLISDSKPSVNFSLNAPIGSMMSSATSDTPTTAPAGAVEAVPLSLASMRVLPFQQLEDINAVRLNFFTHKFVDYPNLERRFRDYDTKSILDRLPWRLALFMILYSLLGIVDVFSYSEFLRLRLLLRYGLGVAPMVVAMGLILLMRVRPMLRYSYLSWVQAGALACAASANIWVWFTLRDAGFNPPLVADAGSLLVLVPLASHFFHMRFFFHWLFSCLLLAQYALASVLAGMQLFPVLLLAVATLLCFVVTREMDISGRAFFLVMLARRKIHKDTSELLSRMLPDEVIPELIAAHARQQQKEKELARELQVSARLAELEEAGNSDVPPYVLGALHRSATLPEVSFSGTSLHGYLMKRGAVVKNWKRRYFYLDKGFLHYLDEEGKPKGRIPIWSANVEPLEAGAFEKDRYTWVFGVTPRDFSRVEDEGTRRPSHPSLAADTTDSVAEASVEVGATQDGTDEALSSFPKGSPKATGSSHWLFGGRRLGTPSVARPRSSSSIRTYILVAQSEEARDEWVRFLRSEAERLAAASGFLRKLGGTVKNWKRRFCYVDACNLYYMDENLELRGSIPLSGARIEVFPDEQFDRRFCFGITPTAQGGNAGGAESGGSTTPAHSSQTPSLMSRSVQQLSDVSSSVGGDAAEETQSANLLSTSFSQRTYVMVADSKEDMMRWIDLLQQESRKRPQPHRHSFDGKQLTRVPSLAEAPRSWDRADGRRGVVLSGTPGTIGGMDPAALSSSTERRGVVSIVPSFDPASRLIADRGSRRMIAHSYPIVTVMIADIVGFTPLCARLAPEDVVWLLNDLFFTFDQLTDWYGVFKVETIGDAYLAVCGCPTPLVTHALQMADLAWAMMETVREFVTEDGEIIQMRIGLHSGPVVGGLVGLQHMPRYHIFGEAVTLTEHLEHNGTAGEIHCSDEALQLLRGTFVSMELAPLVLDGNKVRRHQLLRPAENRLVGAHPGGLAAGPRHRLSTISAHSSDYAAAPPLVSTGSLHAFPSSQDSATDRSSTELSEQPRAPV